MKQLSVILITLSLLNGCVSVTGAKSPPVEEHVVAHNIKYEFDEFKNIGWLNTERYESEIEGGWNTAVRYSYSARLDQHGKLEAIQLYLDYVSQQWMFAKNLYDSKGQKYTLHEVDTNVDGGYVTESFVVVIEKEQLRQFADDDQRFLLEGKKSEGVFTISKVVSLAFLEELYKRKIF